MKKFIALALALAFAMGCFAVAEGEGPEDPTSYICDDINGTSIYWKYDQKFFDAECDQPGTVERIDYVTDAYGEPIETWANVYLPYGFDASGATRYNIYYFLHGTNENQNSFIGEARCKNAIDNMIAQGVVEPLIMVFPTYYYDYENRATDHQVFVSEVRDDLMPAVEAKYPTYAETADEAGFIASRTHRAFGGYSQGSAVTWTLLSGMIDYAKWFMPMSGSSKDNYQPLKDALAKYSDYAGDFFLYLISGGKRDLAYDGVVALINKLIDDPDFSFGIDPTSNNFNGLTGQEVHQTMMARFYLFNAFDVLFRDE